MATDEQIERVRTVQKHYVLNDETVEAFDAVLAELTALRRLADAVIEHEEAAKHDRLKESGFARHNAARRALDAALAEARK